MRKIILSILSVLAVSLFIFSGTSFAAKQTITFKVDGMYCSACPAIIKKVLINVDGVKDAIVSYSQKTAVVTFEDTKTEVTNLIPEPKISESEIVPARKAMLPLELLKFKIAQRRYNQLIWKNIKKDLMFFRQKHRNQSSRNLKTRLRLQIDQFGKVIERRLLKTSGSQKFDKIIMDSVDQLKLPPPMELLIRHPPYVVTILIQP